MVVELSGGWARGFFLMPLGVALLSTGGLLLVRRSLVWLMMMWVCAWPAGFCMWLALWYIWGPGTGTPPVAVIWMALGGWALFWLGVLHSAWRGGVSLGLLVAVTTVAALSAYKVLHPAETGLITLALTGIALGTSIAGCVILVRSMLNAIDRVRLKHDAKGHFAST